MFKVQHPLDSISNPLQDDIVKHPPEDALFDIL